MNKLFERIISDDYYQKYTPQVLSRPSQGTDNHNNEPTDDENDAPWVITLDNFISPDECDRLIQLGAEVGYALSADTGRRNFDGSYEKAHHSGRTSTNAFCTGTCATDPTSIHVTERMANITGISEKNYEYFQLLRYEEGQFYHNHHDFADYHLERQYGPRILTILLYLNDVQEGGGTDFPFLGVQVVPQRGKAVLWPSVRNDDPLAKDQRTEHAALPVIKGLKYAANVWIHQGDFRDTFAKNCM
jgi:prolyl 4-hydroxylase